MVRSFNPQGIPGLLITNTNFPPQNFDETGGGTVVEGFEAIGGTTDNIIFDDGIEDGNIKYEENG